MQKHIKIIFRFFITLGRRFVEDGCSYRAAALTYTTLLSIVPLMTVSFAIFAVFPVFHTISLQIQNFIFAHFVAASGEIIQEYLMLFVAQTRNLSVFGSIFLVLTAILMIFNMEQAFNAIWRIRQRRKGISALLLYWAILTLGPILISLSVAASTYIASLPFITVTARTLNLVTPILTAMPFVLSLIAFTLMNMALPNCKVPFRNALIGGFVAAILFSIAKAIFALYVTNFPTYTLLYGALATIPIFLVWLYLVWVTILFGGLLSNVLTTGYGYRSAIKIDGFTHTLRWLGHLWEARKEGRSLSIQDMIALDSVNYAVRPEKQIYLMEKANLIQSTDTGSYVLNKDLSVFTLKELLFSMPWRLPTEKELQLLHGIWEKNLLEVIKQQGDEIYNTLNKSVLTCYETK